ncbi:MULTISPECIES: glycerol dehydratase reactivase beta/small subunit family protein [Pseudonocardia]|uniref:PduH protein n=2 Tax=Pseudonocardia TaxID=1847 RepID=A0A1Y2MN91_PSEAH|nr:MULTISPECIES: glycerol dehydratase reactivase beta/small subunit family protein [Pseudonocardia]OSY35918.1 hypothetical protein BG845_05756 [Pseudonocardia autotrophica]TDN73974.1 dehydratase medium subunit [Pseudonocardia autotrophica]BBG04728.1 hypothetical protein Pdca_59370 [Pseudonocardia autotrophica]GEC28923.1 hypothetical protein PSA01_59520 [Pseudonocardia saturnea]
MSAVEDPDRPAVLVRHHPDAPAEVLRQVCAGIEEEGVPLIAAAAGPSPSSAGPSSAGSSSAGSSSAGPSSGTPSSGTPSSGTPSSGTPSSADRDGPDAADAATALAHRAALRSRLDTGIGIDSRGRVVVHHAKLPLDRPAYVEPAAGETARAAEDPVPPGRRAGAAAARIVTGLALPRAVTARPVTGTAGTDPP